jgi:hypothetical protein
MRTRLNVVRGLPEVTYVFLKEEYSGATPSTISTCYRHVKDRPRMPITTLIRVVSACISEEPRVAYLLVNTVPIV